MNYSCSPGWLATTGALLAVLVWVAMRYMEADEMTALIESFDYAAAGLADSARQLETRAERIEKLQDRARKSLASTMLDIGAELCVARDTLAAHGTGTFYGWAVGRLGFSETSVKRAVRLYEQFGTLPTVDWANLAQTMDVSAMHLLASPGCPAEIREEAVAKAKSGEKVTHAEVKAAIDAERDPDPAPPAQSIAVPTPRREVDLTDGTWSMLNPSCERTNRERANTEAEEPTDDPAEPDSQDGTTEGEGNQEGMDEEGATEGRFLTEARRAVLDVWGRNQDATKAEVCSSLDELRAEIWETYQ